MIVRAIADCHRSRVIDGSLPAEHLPPTTSLVHSGSAAALPTRSSRQVLQPPHVLKNSTELYDILEGSGDMYIGTRSAPVHPGQIALIPRGRSRPIRNTGTGDLDFLCMVTP